MVLFNVVRPWIPWNVFFNQNSFVKLTFLNRKSVLPSKKDKIAVMAFLDRFRKFSCIFWNIFEKSIEWGVRKTEKLGFQIVMSMTRAFLILNAVASVRHVRAYANGGEWRRTINISNRSLCKINCFEHSKKRAGCADSLRWKWGIFFLLF